MSTDYAIADAFTPRPAALEAGPEARRRWLAALALVAVVGASLAIAVGTAAGVSAVVPIGGPGFPGWLAGPLAGLGPPIGPVGFSAAMAALCASYAALLAFGRALPVRWALAAVAATHVVLLLGPPILNTDVIGYLTYARLGAVHDLNPYTHAPTAISDDPSYPYAGVKWMASPYGPLFTLVTYPLAPLGLAAGVWLGKLLILLSSLGCLALVWRCARRLGQAPLAAVLFVGLNPVWLAWDVGSAHNDAVVALLLVAGICLSLERRHGLAAGALVGASAVKMTAGLALPLAIVGARRRARALGGAALAGAAVAAASLLAFGLDGAAGYVRTLGVQDDFLSDVSVPQYVAGLLGLPGVTEGVHVARYAILAVVGAVLLWRTWRGASWIASAGWATLAMLLTATWFMPWYLSGLLPLAALSGSRRLRAATLALTAFVLATRLSLFFD